MHPNPAPDPAGGEGVGAVIDALVADLADATDAVEVLHIVLGMARFPEATVRRDSRLVEDLGYDSLRLIELSVALEERFGPRFDPTTAVRITTLEDVARSIARVLASET